MLATLFDFGTASEFASSSLNAAAPLASDLTPVLTVIVGVLLLAAVVGILIKVLTKH